MKTIRTKKHTSYTFTMGTRGYRTRRECIYQLKTNKCGRKRQAHGGVKCKGVNCGYFKIIKITDSDLFDWIELFFKRKEVKANDRILISHDLTEELADWMLERITKKLNN